MNNVDKLITSTVNDTSVFLIRDIYDMTTSRRSMTTLSITVQNATLSMTTLGVNLTLCILSVTFSYSCAECRYAVCR